MKKNNIVISAPYNMCLRNLISSSFKFDKKKYNYILFSTIKKKDTPFEIKKLNFLKKYNYSSTSKIFRAVYFFLTSLLTNYTCRKKKWKTMEIIKKEIQSNAKLDKIIEHDYKFCFGKVCSIITNNNFVFQICKITLYFFLFFFSLRYLIIFLFLRPKCVFFLHLHASQDKGLLCAAKMLNIQTHALVHSWDNPTTKLINPLRTSKLYVWNNFLKNEMSYLNKINKKDIHVFGVPQFDVYSKSLNDGHKIKKNKTRILIFLPSPGLVDYDIQKYTLHEIENFFKNNKNFEIIIRSHPGIIPPWLKQFEKRNKNFKINHPNKLFIAGTNDQKLKKADFKKFELAELIKNSEITANFFSTTSLDAIYLDKPVISLCFDYMKYNRIKWYYSWSHQKNLMRFNATSICENIIEFKKELLKYLKHSDYKKYQRKKVKEKFCVFSDGNCGDRLSVIFHKNIIEI